VSVEQLIEWSKLPGLLPRVRYGPDRGKEWSEIDDDSLDAFLQDRDPDIRYTAEVELERRRGHGRVVRPDRQPVLF
jgi:exodeoxyribonuclease X